MKRIVVLLTVVALMMVMVALSVAPAFAAWEGACRTGGFTTSVQTAYDASKDRNGDNVVCYTLKGANQNYIAYDNRQA
jgi:uncharacterized protein YxeA